jgi:histidinol-phosphate aminotransferase
VVDALNRVRGAFNVNLPAQVAAVAALADQDWIERTVTHTLIWRERLAEAIRALGIVVWPSEGNFLLIDFRHDDRAAAANAWLRDRGIVVRAMGGYALPTCLRVTIGTEEECMMVAEALSGFVAARPRDV